MILLTVFAAFCVLAVDVGRCQSARGELQDAADAAARYAVSGSVRSATKVVTARVQAAAICAQQRVDGRTITVAPNAVEVGNWSVVTRTFTSAPTDPYANAVRVTLNVTVGGTGSAPTFAAILGGTPPTYRAVSVATAVSVTADVIAPTSGNVWLSGAPDNTVITNLQTIAAKYDSSGTTLVPKQRPTGVAIGSMGITPGDTLSLEGIDGWGNNGSGASTYGLDGKLDQMVSVGNSNSPSVPTTGVNGIANTRAPLSACIAVFLSDDPPSNSATPAGLDFGTATQRDYASLSPQLKQPFFIGDGKRDNGEVQAIVVPPGATRLFIGMMDAWQWNDNTGSYHFAVYRAPKVTTVK